MQINDSFFVSPEIPYLRLSRLRFLMLSFFSGVLLLFRLLSLDMLRLRSRDWLRLRLDFMGEKLLLSCLSLDLLLDLLSRESPLLLVFNAQAFKSEGIPPSLASVLGLFSSLALNILFCSSGFRTSSCFLIHLHDRGPDPLQG